MLRILKSACCILLLAKFIFAGNLLFGAEVTIIDSRHYSNVLGEIRNFRIFLPPGYKENPHKKYPVIYYYHGWSQRYFGSTTPGGIDKGDHNDGDNIANYVVDHDVIVVKPDGYNRNPEDVYYLRPYNISPVETFRQFPLYFPELVRFIDLNYRTIANREKRAISGLSMGGFMSFWIGGKYPHLVSAVGNFCGSAEFIIGPKNFPVEYRHIDMYNNYKGINVRLNFGNQDFIRYYHRDMNRVWTQVMDNYQYKIYNAAHSTCGLHEMFDFIMNTFDNPPEKPAAWDHIDVFPDFNVWDYDVSSDRDLPGYTILENVNKRGFRCSVREFLPDGRLMPYVSLSVRTAPIYEKNRLYTVNDIDINTLESTKYSVRSDSSGRLFIPLDGSDHEIGINKPVDEANISVVSFVSANMDLPVLNKDINLKIRLLNKGLKRAEGLKITMLATRESTNIIKADAEVGNIDINCFGETKAPLTFRIQSDSIEIAKFHLIVRDKNSNEWREYIEVPLLKEMQEIKNFEIADGKKVTVASEGVKTETIILGSGNGDGIANPGESIVVLVKDLDKLWRTSLTVSNEFINPFGINIRGSDNWSSYDHVGGSAKFSVPLVASSCPDGRVIDFVAEYWLPDYPNHIIKQGVVRLKITGKDATPPVLQWVRIPGDNIIQAKINDGADILKVKAKLYPEKNTEKYFEVELKDDGTNGDRKRGDNVFSYEIPEQKFGLYKAEITANDLYGNGMTEKWPDIFVLH